MIIVNNSPAVTFFSSNPGSKLKKLKAIDINFLCEINKLGNKGGL